MNNYRSWAAEGDEEDEEEVTASVITDTQASSVVARGERGDYYRRTENDNDDDDNVEEGLPEELPEYACSYCGYHDPDAAVQCNICHRWFCNGKGNMNASHIILHLLESKHNEVSTTENSVMGADVISCYLCGTTNIFVLGLVPIKNEDGDADTTAVPLCRDICRHQSNVEYEWDPETWLPLIEGRQLQANIVAAPSPKEMKRCRNNILSVHVKQLEECWKNGNTVVTMDTILNGELPMEVMDITHTKFENVPDTFKDGKTYYEKWMPLVQDECSEAEIVSKNIKLKDVSVEWEKQGNKVIGTFTTFAEGMRMRGGSRLELTLPNRPNFSLTAVVLSNKINNTVGVILKIELETEHSIPTESKGFTVGLIFMPVPYKRMEKALLTFMTDHSSVSNYLYNAILGGDNSQPAMEFKEIREKLPNHISVPGLAPLNESQERAVRESLLKPLTLIQGPPGTGKTTTTASIVYCMSTMWNGQVLVAAPSNVAANELAERIARTRLVVLRVLAKSQEDVPNSVERLCLHKQVEEFVQRLPSSHPLFKLFKLYQEMGSLRPQDEQRLNDLMKKAEEDIIGAADVVVVTCSAAASARLEKFRFEYVVIDEIAQSCEPEAIIPIVTGARQLVLVGDHCQLGPVCRSRAAEKAGLGRSLFERLFRFGAKRLEIQYRMHPFLSQFSSESFYEGTLQNGVRPEERDSSTRFPWPNPDKPMIFYNSIAPEELGSSGTSNLNRVEAALAEKFLTILIKNGVRPVSVGIVTPYEAQRAYLVNYLMRSGALGPTAYQDVEVSSVDGFQGREKDFIIMSCVRSNENYAIGFLKDWQRLNVALTRARYGIIIIGNARVLGRHPLWHSFLTHCKVNNIIVEGPPQAVYSVDITLPKPHLSLEAMNTNNAMSIGQEGGGGHRNMYAVSAATEDGMSTIGETMVDEVYVPGHRGMK